MIEFDCYQKNKQTDKQKNREREIETKGNRAVTPTIENWTKMYSSITLTLKNLSTVHNKNKTKQKRRQTKTKTKK